jgi:hypothetical protein
MKHFEMIVSGEGLEFRNEWLQSLGMFAFSNVAIHCTQTEKNYCYGQSVRFLRQTRRTIVVFYLVMDAALDALFKNYYYCFFPR